jgi:hypothetical protein
MMMEPTEIGSWGAFSWSLELQVAHGAWGRFATCKLLFGNVGTFQNPRHFRTVAHRDAPLPRGQKGLFPSSLVHGLLGGLGYRLCGTNVHPCCPDFRPLRLVPQYELVLVVK